ncbi:MAG: MarR family transcriptional regulator [Planctomycetes bacterium]|nr:MarR family transcriptional regulator [Planctomycetota bacterium]
METNHEAKVRFVRNWVRLASVIWRYGRHLHQTHGIWGPQFGVLRLLEGLGPSSMSDLEPFLPGQLSALTQMVDRLEQGGWVHRERDPQDRRRVVLHLTDKARAFLDAEPPIGPPRAARAIDDATPQGAARLADAMETVVDAMIGDATAEIPEDSELPWVGPTSGDSTSKER